MSEAIAAVAASPARAVDAPPAGRPPGAGESPGPFDAVLRREVAPPSWTAPENHGARPGDAEREALDETAPGGEAVVAQVSGPASLVAVALGATLPPAPSLAGSAGARAVPAPRGIEDTPGRTAADGPPAPRPRTGLPRAGDQGHGGRVGTAGLEHVGDRTGSLEPATAAADAPGLGPGVSEGAATSAPAAPIDGSAIAGVGEIGAAPSASQGVPSVPRPMADREGAGPLPTGDLAPGGVADAPGRRGMTSPDRAIADMIGAGVRPAPARALSTEPGTTETTPTAAAPGPGRGQRAPGETTAGTGTANAATASIATARTDSARIETASAATSAPAAGAATASSSPVVLAAAAATERSPASESRGLPGPAHTPGVDARSIPGAAGFHLATGGDASGAGEPDGRAGPNGQPPAGELSFAEAGETLSVSSDAFVSPGDPSTPLVDQVLDAVRASMSGDRAGAANRPEAADPTVGDRLQVAADLRERPGDRGEVPGDRHVVTLRLDPPALGHLQVRAVLDGDRLSLHFLVDGEPARQALSQVIPALREALGQQGLVAGQVAVDVGAGGTPGDASRDAAWMRPPLPAPGDPGSRWAAPRGAGAGQSHSGTIDVWA